MNTQSVHNPVPARRSSAPATLVALLASLVSFALGACTTPVDPRPFADATAALASAVKTSGQAVESQLRASSLPNASDTADRLHATWSVRVAVMERTVAYTDGLRQIRNAAAESGKVVQQIAGDVTAIAAAAGLVLPPAAAIGAGVDIAAVVYQNINNARAAETIKQSLQHADLALAGIAQHLERDTANLRGILRLTHDQARDDVEREDPDLLDRVHAARDGLADAAHDFVVKDRKLEARIRIAQDKLADLAERAAEDDPALNDRFAHARTEIDGLAGESAKLAGTRGERMRILNEYAGSQSALLAAREARLAQLDAAFTAQSQLIDAANRALVDWSAAHSRLVIAVRERRPVSVESLVQTTNELRELIRKVREQ